MPPNRRSLRRDTGPTCALERDIAGEASVHAAVRTVMDAHGRIDVVMHNAGHMVIGLSEAFTPDQQAQLYDTNVIGTRRRDAASQGLDNLLAPDLQRQRCV